MLASPARAADEAAGQRLAFDRDKGNCLSCHAMGAAALHGNVGPALINMGERFADRSELRARIWDPTRFNSDSIMPPYGRHGILTETEIDLITDFVHGL